jgi:hypothetical protein
VLRIRDLFGAAASLVCLDSCCPARQVLRRGGKIESVVRVSDQLAISHPGGLIDLDEGGAVVEIVLGTSFSVTNQSSESVFDWIIGRRFKCDVVRIFWGHAAEILTC